MDGDRRVALLASSQRGVLTTSQARALGLSRRQVQWRIASGRWEQLHHEVVRIAGSPPSWHQEVIAAVLACPGSAASHTTAGRLAHFSYLPPDDGRVHILRAHGRHHDLAGVMIHQSRSLPPHHVTHLDGIAMTTPARTAFDLAATLGAKRFRRLVDDQLAAKRLDLTSLERMHAELARRGRPGSRLFGLILDERQGQYVPPASELEARFLELCERAGLPRPTRQRHAPWGDDEGPRSKRVDMAFEPERVLVELDSWRYHSSMTAFEGDRRRDQLTLAAGWRPIRFTWRQITEDPQHVIAVLRAVLESPGHI